MAMVAARGTRAAGHGPVRWCALARAVCAVCALRTRKGTKESQIHYETLRVILCSHRGFIERFLPETTNRRLISRRRKTCHAQKMKIITAHGLSPLTRHQTGAIRALSSSHLTELKMKGSIIPMKIVVSRNGRHWGRRMSAWMTIAAHAAPVQFTQRARNV